MLKYFTHTRLIKLKPLFCFHTHFIFLWLTDVQVTLFQNLQKKLVVLELSQRWFFRSLSVLTCDIILLVLPVRYVITKYNIDTSCVLLLTRPCLEYREYLFSGWKYGSFQNQQLLQIIRYLLKDIFSYSHFQTLVMWNAQNGQFPFVQ